MYDNTLVTFGQNHVKRYRDIKLGDTVRARPVYFLRAVQDFELGRLQKDTNYTVRRITIRTVGQLGFNPGGRKEVVVAHLGNGNQVNINDLVKSSK